MTVFVDSGGFVSVLFRSDRHHAVFQQAFVRLPKKLFTSTLVVSETYSWFLHKLDEEAARQFLAFVDALSPLVVLDVPATMHSETKVILNKFRGSKLTYVDAVSLVLIKKHKIAQVWGTDYDLTFTGAKLIV